MERLLESQVTSVLSELLECPLQARSDAARSQVDLLLEGDERLFLVERARSASIKSLEAATEKLRTLRLPLSPKPSLPVIAVPFMGEVGKQFCRSVAVSWMDLAGNAHLRGPGLHIRIEGRPRPARKPGRPANVFAPKSARVTRQLLLDPHRTFRQKDLAHETGLGEGFVSRIVRQLDAEGFVTKERGVIHVRNPGLLLDAWREAYAFSHHHIVRGHIPARSPQALLGSMTATLRDARLPHAATGLASAWMHSRFAGFRVIALYVERLPPFDLLHFRPEEGGANVWWVVPDDPGVFTGAVDIEGIRCVSAVQTYVDLFAMPERAKEAAEDLRLKKLPWSLHG